MIKHLFSLMLSACAAVLLVTACQDPAPEKDPVQEGETKTIPFCLSVKTEGTKVSYEGNHYSFKSGDRLHVVGVDRDDIEGYLSNGGEGNVWSGDLTYLISKGEPGSATRLAVTLIHADNPDVETYATAIVGNVSSESSLLREAVEHYSLFTAEVTLATTEAVLKQQATFLDATVTFVFDGTHQIEAGKALVDLRTASGEAMEEIQFVPLSNGKDFKVNFMAVVPGDKLVKDFTLTVADRAITFTNNSLQLDRNMKYTITRSITYGPQLGDPFWSDGTYGRMQHPNSNVSIVGVIVYVNHNYAEGTPEAALDDAITEKAYGFGHGLVMALTNAAVDVAWSSAEGKIKCTENFVTEPEHTLEGDKLSGYKNTEKIRTALNGVNAYSSSAAYLAEHYTYNGIGVSTQYTTGWFLPSIGQWMYTISIDGFGAANHASQWINGNGVSWLQNGYSNDGNLGDLVLVKDCPNNEGNVLVNSLNERLRKFQEEFHVAYDPFGDPSATNNVSDNYWSSSEKDANSAIRMNFGSVRKRGNNYYSTIKVKGETKTKTIAYSENSVDYKFKVRPFLAF
ncbi:MAG: hypothetical protein J5702_02470 [Bacteroidales bacterium]|nr:hypothetical protein [Bacteroidales bacterium]